MGSVFDRLVEAYPAWWIDALGEFNHIGGEESTRWLMDRAGLVPGARVLDAGCFVGATARLVAEETGAAVTATDIGQDFIDAGREMAGGQGVDWLVADTRRLPFADGSFASTWCMDSHVAMGELTRVTAENGTICLCAVAPLDATGALWTFREQWEDAGWRIVEQKLLSTQATQVWRGAEMDLVGQRAHFQERYGARGYMAQLDIVAELVRAYEYREMGHGLFVLRRDA